jgi:hypothetical protein
MRDADFLGSGTSNIDDWDREIDPRVVEYSGLDDPGALLVLLAEKRRIGAFSGPAIAPQPEPATKMPPPSSASEGSSAIYMGLIGLGLAAAGLVLALSDAPALLAGCVIAALVLGALVLPWVMRGRPPLTAVVLAVTAAVLAVGIGWHFGISDSDGPYRFFLATTGSDRAVVIPLIEPRVGATWSRSTVLAPGDPLEVSCIQDEDGVAWAKLSDATFMRLALLVPEFAAGSQPPAC